MGCFHRNYDFFFFAREFSVYLQSELNACQEIKVFCCFTDFPPVNSIVPSLKDLSCIKHFPFWRQQLAFVCLDTSLLLTGQKLAGKIKAFCLCLHLEGPRQLGNSTCLWLPPLSLIQKIEFRTKIEVCHLLFGAN